MLPEMPEHVDERWYSPVLDPRAFDSVVSKVHVNSYLEARLLDEDGLDRGHALFCVEEVYSASDAGLTLRCSLVAARSPRVSGWLHEVALADNGDSFLHLCRGPQRDCPFRAPGHTIVHCDKWRLRGLEGITEQWAVDGQGPTDSSADEGSLEGGALGNAGLLEAAGQRPSIGPTPIGGSRGAGARGAHHRAGDARDAVMDRVAALAEDRPFAALGAGAARPSIPGPLADTGIKRGLGPAAVVNLDGEPAAAPAGSGAPVDVALLRTKLAEAKAKVAAAEAGKVKQEGAAAADQCADTPKAKRKKKNDVRMALLARATDFQPVEVSAPGPVTELTDDADKFTDSDDEAKVTQVFRKAPSSQKIQDLAARKPGTLLTSGLEMMSKYLDPRAGGRGGSVKQGDLGAPRVVRYLTTVVQVASSSGVGVRNERELRTLAEALDAMILGDLARAADILMMRFKAVELASSSSDWSSAKYLELIPQTQVSSLTEGEQDAIARQKIRDAKLNKYLSGGGEGRRS